MKRTKKIKKIKVKERERPTKGITSSDTWYKGSEEEAAANARMKRDISGGHYGRGTRFG